MRRAARLQAAIKWRNGYRGNNVARSYARWFGVDLVCAIIELRMLGVAIDAEYDAQIRRTITAQTEARARRRAAWLADRTEPTAIERPDDWPPEWIADDDEAAAAHDIPF